MNYSMCIDSVCILYVQAMGKFIPDPYGTQGLFAETGETWRDYRHVLTPAFSASKMKLVRHRKPATS